jgi:hypothetical protein
MGSEGDREGVVTDAEASAEARRQQGAAPASSPGTQYAIRVEGHLDAHWSEWLEGMTLTHEECGLTRLEGPIRDQAALYGLLNRLRDLSLTLVTVQRIEAVESGVALAEEPPARSG